MVRCAWQELIALLALIGLVYIRPNAPRRFYPTHLVVDLCSETRGAVAGGDKKPVADSASNDMDAEVQQGRCLMIETNYRIYAYTTSVLQEKILELFSEICYKLPHMLIGVITRVSVRKALVHGISARQIIEYLHMHAHPQVALAPAPLPFALQCSAVCCRWLWARR